MKKFWSFSFYFLYFASLSGLVPFLVLFYQGLGFSGAEIGLLTGIPPLITLVASPFWNGLADARRLHKFVMGLGILAVVLIMLLLPSLNSFAVVFLMIVLFNNFLGPVSSLADSSTMNMLGDEREMYGRVRLGGTFGWGILAPIAGVLVQNYGLRMAFWSFCVLMTINFFVSQRLSHGSPEAGISSNSSVRFFLTNRRWINFLFLAFLGGIGTYSVSSYLFPYMAELGANESTMGIALTIATLTELPIFFFGNRLVRKLGSYSLLILSLVLFGIRSLLYALVSTPFMVLLVQVLGGTIYPILWVAGVSYADENAPAGSKASAQGLFGAVTFGFGSAIGGFAGGLLLKSIGGRGMFLVMGIVILLGLVAAEGIRRFFPDKNELPQSAALTGNHLES
ncbi:MAG TPA: major facilitator superfamily domain-containing protein 6 [Anaerolineales bacterium]|nr:major facilitator superfamily domain-containing protein 6 [Anaerolineales bacterium]